MTENVMYNVREKLSKSRELCEGMSERAYLLADYISEIAPDSITPFGLAECLLRAIEDTYQEGWRKGTIKKELRLSFVLDSKRIRNQAVNIPQIIDVIGDKDFAEEFRTICKEQFDFNPPKYGTQKQLEDYPEYAKVAVNWWAKAILFPKMNTSGAAVPSSVYSIIEEEVDTRSYSEEDLLVFKTTIADEIMEDITAWNVCTLSVDYHPCDALKVAGNKIGVHKVFGYPLRTDMSIWEYEVKVRVGDGAKYETLWTRN